MGFILQISIVLCPILAITVLAISATAFEDVLKKYSGVTELALDISNIRGLFPTQIKKQLAKEKSFDENDKRIILSKYRQLIISLLFYVLFWIVYVGVIIFRIVLIFKTYNLIQPEVFGANIASILMCCLVTNWFLLLPISEALNFKKLEKIQYASWRFMNFVLDHFARLRDHTVNLLVKIVISCALLYGYIKIILFFFQCNEIAVSFWLLLAALSFYHYAILRFVCLILQKAILLVGKIRSKSGPLVECASQGKIYLHLKNCTYLSMVYLYAVATDLNLSSSPIASAIAVLFLFDTFIVQEKSLKDNQQPTNDDISSEES